MRILLFAPSFPPAVASGGPARSLANLVAKQRSTHHFTVVCPDRDAFSSEPFPALSGRRVERPGVTVYYADLADLRQVVSLLHRLAPQDFDLVLLNSLWNRRLTLLPMLLHRAGLLRGRLWALAPRGELDPGALRLKPIRKELAGPLVAKLVRETADVISCTSETEQRQAERLLPGVPTVRCSNLPDVLAPGHVPNDSDALRVVFVGRISRKKGLLQAIEALGAATYPMTFAIHGPLEEPDYWSECSAAIEDLGQAVTVEYCGPLGRDQVRGAFAGADVFLFPTQGENFGHVIAEALQVGCPVILPDVTPWSDHLAKIPNCLLPADAQPRDFAVALDAWAVLGQTELQETRRLARRAFDEWRHLGEPDMVESLIAWASTRTQGKGPSRAC